MKFSNLREFLANASIIVPPTPLITPTDELKFSKYVGDIIDYSKKLNSLELKPEVTFNVIDLDDTLYSRYPQLEMPLFSENRGLDGNRVIDDYLGRERFIDMFFDERLLNTYFQGILANSDENYPSLILTAGDADLQIRKLDKLKLLGKANITIVPDSSHKLKHIIDYIIGVLGYIPGKIIIYDDKVKSYKDSLPSAAKILKTEIVLNEVVPNPLDLLNVSHMNQTKYDSRFTTLQ